MNKKRNSTIEARDKRKKLLITAGDKEFMNLLKQRFILRIYAFFSQSLMVSVLLGSQNHKIGLIAPRAETITSQRRVDQSM
jgi:hypothetical protein